MRGWREWSGGCRQCSFGRVEGRREGQRRRYHGHRWEELQPARQQVELLNQQVQTGRERQEELVSRTNVAEARSGLAFGLLEALQAGDATGIERATDALTEAGFVSCRWECRSSSGQSREPSSSRGVRSATPTSDTQPDGLSRAHDSSLGHMISVAHLKARVTYTSTRKHSR